MTGKTSVLVLGTDAGWKKTEEFKRLLKKGRKFRKVTQKELESHSTQVTQDLMLTLDDLGPRQGISFVKPKFMKQTGDLKAATLNFAS